ncbi:MAG: FAD-dependent thymidylate synthase [Bacteroidota bacterium]|jgi:thymidylate synthase (FAD)
MVELLKWFGDDMDIVDKARISFDKSSENYSLSQNTRLINYLAEEEHTLPFRHQFIQFRITTTIYVERQLFKHEIGVTKSSISGRYVDFSARHTAIGEGNWRMASKVAKQGSGDLCNPKVQKELAYLEDKMINYAMKTYEKMLQLGACKEQARSILLLNLNTTFIMTLSLQAFLHMCRLRLKPDAQKETRDVVQQMLDLVVSIPSRPFHHAMKTWGIIE